MIKKKSQTQWNKNNTSSNNEKNSYKNIPVTLYLGVCLQVTLRELSSDRFPWVPAKYTLQSAQSKAVLKNI